MKHRFCWLALMAFSCFGVSSLCAAQPLGAENHRISVQVLDPAAVPVSQWQVKVQATYSPLTEGAPNTTETTTTRANCAQPSRFGGSLLPSFKRCTRTSDRTVEQALTGTQIFAPDAHTLNLDFAPVIEDHGGAFKVDEVYVDYMTCAKGCEPRRLEIHLTCYDAEAGEVLSDGLLLTYSRGNKANPQVAQCGLHAGDEINWANRDTVMGRVRGHFGDAQQMVSNELLDVFSAIPGANHQWLWNPARGSGKFGDYCTLPDNQSYVNSLYTATLPATVGWPYQHEVEVRVYSKPDGTVCNIWLTGSGDETYLRYFYDFVDGKLMRVYTSGEPKDVTHVWRWVNGQPWEFTRRQVPDSVAGHDTILYWHKTAAEQWPKRMDYKPDVKEFAALSNFAQQLLSRFPVKPQ